MTNCRYFPPRRNPQTEKAAALAIVERGLAQGFHAKVLFEDGMEGCDFTDDLALIGEQLQATSMEFAVFAAPPARKGDSYARRGAITFIWGNGTDDVVADFTDNLYMRQIVEGFDVPAAA